ncbi:MAG: hypothetical protein UT86_C0001G0013 [Candidatus Magasanikbacteria bacterium GW2011_GWC2_40_17]|uniref:Glycosyltransferase RgtA/B/C/D-like domain-containing protein n=1 Tax=Candidatus Magasanikbacteria bacterium GW2011_GWA2_42_32 TaxID=1619039 RepID=A0A0G1D5N9_9BACT|nr:MAG: hypothetical protein UT86_C0001G0013 [Candidatus Magasanikbacteria bacterium GW2011_GWC2_40_17]KKS57373.1 MAG: hypothetical protein UV20_C0001G0013 [Candidatus Magasanikbacteria bacterium GW2011_GWA2_42_32]
MKLKEKIKNILIKPVGHLFFLTLLLVLFYSQSTITLMDDAFLYESFTEKLVNEQKIDFSIPGFHGGDFLSAPIYWLTHSSISVAILDIIAALASIWMIYLAVKTILKRKIFGVLAAYIYVLNILDYSNALRGHHHTPMIFFTLLGLYLLFANSRLSFLAFGISYIIRPFGIALAPLFLYQKKIGQFFASLIIPAVYLIIEYWQIGKIQIGVHTNLTVETLFSLKRFFMNLAYAFQNYFSIHNYSFLNQVDPSDMIHLSPFITFFALLAVVNYKKYFNDKKLFLLLLLSSIIALILPAGFNHLDMWYLWIFNFTLILLALPVILDFPLFMPVIALSFGFQFFYAFLVFKGIYWNNYAIFFIPMIIFAVSIVYVFYHFWVEQKKEKI